MMMIKDQNFSRAFAAIILSRRD